MVITTLFFIYGSQVVALTPEELQTEQMQIIQTIDNTSSNSVIISEGTVYWEGSELGGTGKCNTVTNQNFYVPKDRKVKINGISYLNADGEIIEYLYKKEYEYLEYLEIWNKEIPNDTTQIMVHISTPVTDLGWTNQANVFPEMKLEDIEIEEEEKTEVKEIENESSKYNVFDSILKRLLPIIAIIGIPLLLFLLNRDKKEREPIYRTPKQFAGIVSSKKGRTLICVDISASMKPFVTKVLRAFDFADMTAFGERIIITFNREIQEISREEINSIEFYGETNLYGALNKAKKYHPDHIIIISDLYDNVGKWLHQLKGVKTIEIYCPNENYSRKALRKIERKIAGIMSLQVLWRFEDDLLKK